MRYFIPLCCLTFSISVAAADNKPDQTWTENHRPGATLAQETQSNAPQAPTRKPWTEEYQYGKNDVPKTGKPEEGGEIEVAPRK